MMKFVHVRRGMRHGSLLMGKWPIMDIMTNNHEDASSETGTAIPGDDPLVLLMKTQSEPEANIVKGILEEAGIHCTFLTPVVHSLHPFTVDGLAMIQIRVLASQLESAQALLSDYEAEVDLDAGNFPEE